jgi:DNA-binding CsgD family transcriptional regulator
MQSSPRAEVGGPTNTPLAPKSNTAAGAGCKDGPGELHKGPLYAAASAARSSLTVREIEVIKYLAKGLLYKEIADKMGISFAIVHKLQHKIFVKLHVGNRTEAINHWNSGIRA